MRLFTHASRFNQRLTIILALTVLLLGGLALLAQSARAQYPAQVAGAPPPPAAQSSGIPQTHGSNGAPFTAPAAPAAPYVTLYDQYNNAGTTATSSQDFELANAAFSDQTADDFLVPNGQNWQVTEVDVQGQYFNGPGPAASMNVFFYTNSGTLPATPVYSATGLAYVNTSGAFVIPLTTMANLTGGATYWVSVQARQDFTPAGQFGWTDRLVASNSPAAFRNPGGGFACPSGGAWAVKTSCVPTAGGPDQVFRLVGNIVGGSTPTPTPTGGAATATPTACSVSNYVIVTDTATIVPGVVDVGNHGDDVVTTINLPFPVTIYNQSFNTAIVGSNGTLGFVANGNAFTNACLPAAAENFAILPYWDDQQTDIGLSGCSAFTNGCGIFTTTVGSTLYIDYHTVLFSNNATALEYEIALTQGSSNFNVRYGTTIVDTASETIGVQRDTGSLFTQYKCNVASPPITAGLRLNFNLPPCGTATVTPTPGASTPTRTNTPVVSPTRTVTPGGGSATATPCGPGAPGTWTAVATVITARSRTGLAYFPANGKFYMLGGESSTANRNNPFEEYDPVANTWTNRATPIAGVSNTGAATVGNYIYLPAGYDGVGGRTEMQRFDPIANAVVTVSPVPAGVFANAVATQGGKIYVLGGSTTGAAGTTNYIYDTVTGLWTTGAPLSTAVQYAAAASDGTYIYVLGGNTTDLTTVQRYDPVANTWATRAPMLQGRGGPGAFFDGQYIWAVGGGWTLYRNTTEYYNPTTDTWTMGPTLITGARTIGATFGGGIALKVAGFNGAFPANAEKLPFTGGPCSTPTSGPSSTPTATRTTVSGATPSATSTSPPVITPSATRTSTPSGAGPTATATACTIQFTDVDQNNPFYSFIRCLACRQIVSGYSDGTYRWGADVTRGQLSKIIANAAGLTSPIPSTQQTFQDVPNSNAFWLFVERLSATNAISGYTCGGAGEPCVPPGNRPYFRWGANATRGQIAKIDAIAAGYADVIPTTQQTFQDVPSTNPFWLWIEELASRTIISGYNCGGAGEPCVPPGNKPYFRWTANATRGQMAKIAAQTFFPNCSTPARALPARGTIGDAP